MVQFLCHFTIKTVIKDFQKIRVAKYIHMHVCMYINHLYIYFHHFLPIAFISYSSEKNCCLKNSWMNRFPTFFFLIGQLRHSYVHFRRGKKIERDNNRILDTITFRFKFICTFKIQNNVSVPIWKVRKKIKSIFPEKMLKLKELSRT